MASPELIVLRDFTDTIIRAASTGSSDFANKLFAKRIISRSVRDKATSTATGLTGADKASELVKGIEAKLTAVSDNKERKDIFYLILQQMDDVPLDTVAKKMREEYAKVAKEKGQASAQDEETDRGNGALGVGNETIITATANTTSTITGKEDALMTLTSKTTEATKTATPNTTNTSTHAREGVEETDSSKVIKLPSVEISSGTDFEYQDYYNEEIIYKMNEPTRGYCLIIHMPGDPGTDKDREPGNNEDVAKLKQLFESLKFAVAEYANYTKAEIERLIEKVREDNHNLCCFVMFILAHGNDYQGSAYFETYDRQCYEVSELKKQIQSIRSLNDKPKLLFLQTCRGKEINPGIEACFDNAKIIPIGSDFLLSSATIKDYAAYRGLKGSPFIQHLCNVFEKYNKKYDVVSMMTIVIKRVADIDEVEMNDGKKVKFKQNPEIVSTFRKFLYLGEPPSATSCYLDFCNEKKKLN